VAVEPVARPTAFRRRLALAFVLAVGLATAGLHLTAFVLVRDSLLRGSVDRAMPAARFAVDLATEHVGAAAGTEDDELEAVIEELQRRTRFDAVLIHGPDEFRSSNAIGLDQIPDELEEKVRSASAEEEDLPYVRTEIDDLPHLIFGADLPETDDQLYLVVAQQRVTRDISDIRRIFLASWVVVVLAAALLGSLMARRVLQPIAKASGAARSLAEGLLDTRIPSGPADEFGAWTDSFNQMADALQAKITALREARDRERRFTADVSHELRTPLTALMGAASVLSEELDGLPQSARRPAELLIQDVRRLRLLVDDVMEISRLDAGQEAIIADRFDAADVIRSFLRARDWSDRVRLVATASSISSDVRCFERVISNLIHNALEHGSEPVDVSVATAGEAIEVVVSDTGPGIPEDHLPKLFDRFYKVDPSRSSEGSGLGLAIARENARLLGGDISVESEPGRGTSFRVVLPRDRSVTEE
jgi:two-component system sensor histidine kinase MtrB